MANLITNTTLVDTDRKLVIKYSELGVDTATNTTTIVDVSEFSNSGGETMTGVAIEKLFILPSIGIANTAMSGHIEWATSNSDAEVPIAGITANNIFAGNSYDFSAWGGLTKEGTNASGDIKLDVALLAANEGYSFVLEMRKIF